MDSELHCITDTFPLLMDQNVAVNSEPEHEYVVSIAAPYPQGTSNEVKIGNSSHSQGSVIVAIHPLISSQGASLTHGNATGFAVGSSVGPSSSSSSTSSHSQLIPVGDSFTRLRSSDEPRDNSRLRINPLNYSLWTFLELAFTVCQIIASVVVLLIARDEKPQSPLALWIVGYAGCCAAALPILYWRYTHNYSTQELDTSLHGSPHLSPSSNTLSSLPTSHGVLVETSDYGQELEGDFPTSQALDDTVSRTTIHVERFKIVLDCFIAIWFVIGNIWVFGGPSSSHDAPNLYRLCIVFLTFSCISYATPFVICATVCCCLPCIITLLSYRDDQAQRQGAAPEVIAAMPIYKFKVNGSAEKASNNENDSDSESIGEGGIFAPGTNKERVVSGEDSVCCICLEVYKDGMDLKELQCSHFFHAKCVDKWLKINASCPLCKQDIGKHG